MTKREQEIMRDLIGTVQALTDRIEKLEGTRNKSTSKTPTKSPKTDNVVGGLIFDGKYVKTGDLKSSKARYAIGMRIQELGGKKLAKGNTIFDKAHELDKYVQVYEFKTVKDCENFKAEQQARLSK